MQQGGSPTPFDRNMGTKQGAKAVEWFVSQLKENCSPDGTVYANTNESVVMIGVLRRHYCFTPLSKIRNVTNFE